MPTKTMPKPEAPALIDAGLTPELYEGQWRAKKRFTACFHDTPDVEKDTPLTAELFRTAKGGTPIYHLFREGKVVQTVSVKTLEDLCKR